MNELQSAEAVIEFLGGYKAVAELTNAKVDAVYNWKRFGFPARTYPHITTALEARQCRAPLHLWRTIGAAHSTERGAA